MLDGADYDDADADDCDSCYHGDDENNNNQNAYYKWVGYAANFVVQKRPVGRSHIISKSRAVLTLQFILLKTFVIQAYYVAI